MCKWGTNTIVEVTVPAFLSHTGQARQKIVDVDSCIAPLVKALNAGGIATVNSCCGHGHLPPSVILAVEEGFSSVLDPSSQHPGCNGKEEMWLILLPRSKALELEDSYGVNILGEPFKRAL